MLDPEIEDLETSQIMFSTLSQYHLECKMEPTVQFILFGFKVEAVRDIPILEKNSNLKKALVIKGFSKEAS